MTEVTIIKRLEDCTDEDLLNMTEEQVEDLIDYECVHTGVRLLPEMPVKPTEEAPKEDFEFFEVSELQFVNKEDAEKIAELAASMDRIESKYESGPTYTRIVTGTKKEDPGIQKKKKFSEEYLNQVKVKKQRIEERKKEYNELKKEYDDISEARSSIIDNVFNKLKEARQAGQRLIALRDESHRYLKLAIGDKEIAQRFMTDAFPDAVDLIKEHFEAWAIHHVTETMTNAA
ncbi:hypothetical protein KAR91_65230 [Candidatus Pacearchaeota archaeon]|nr:hypothetical protein [Candidatus Pacearchaeota archaeon]